MNNSDLPLFSSSTVSDKLALEWQKCKAKHPGLLVQLAGLARELKRAGHPRYSMDGLFHILRWETRTSTGDLGLKINNNYSGRYARKFHDDFPEHDGFFRTRVIKGRSK